MITHPRSTLPLTGLRSIHNARTRIYAAGRDTLFTSSLPKRSIRVEPAYPENKPAGAVTRPLWRSDVVDRLQTPLTRHRD